ncbi:EamA family transporter RarD [Psychrobacter sp. A3]|uniref:EamA family transporter RarD n=1 Tax=Psychrobacter sp. A3 TaxID=2992754 RepID=UPI00237C360C|nr:EamA family transporter RarD [Psychrobacter sp. A3]MDE0491385.1 EamA family transporter RarD [Psychrobacter sp. A3]
MLSTLTSKSRFPTFGLGTYWHSRSASERVMMSGIALLLFSSVLFGVLYLYSNFLAPLSGTQVFLWRIVAMWTALVLVLMVSGRLGEHVAIVRGLRTWRAWALLLLPTPIFLSQFWLFMWAPVNGQSIQTAMGYFLLPLTMVLSGCVVFKERLSLLQWLAVGLAVLGVSAEIWRTHSVSWATLWVCSTYPIYFVVRRVQGISAVTGLLFDLTVALPFILAYLWWIDSSSLAIVGGSGLTILLLAGLGVISVLAMKTNIDASQLLPLNMYGMLSYVEPAILFVLAVTVLGNPLETAMLYSYGLIWLGIVCLLVHGARQLRRPRDTEKTLPA